MMTFIVAVVLGFIITLLLEMIFDFDLSLPVVIFIVWVILPTTDISNTSDNVDNILAETVVQMEDLLEDLTDEELWETLQKELANVVDETKMQVVVAKARVQEAIKQKRNEEIDTQSVPKQEVLIHKTKEVWDNETFDYGAR